MVALKVHDLDTGETRTIHAWPDSDRQTANEWLADVLANDKTHSEVYYLSVDEPDEAL